MTRFLVNKMEDLSGEVTDMAMILHNLMLIGPTYKEGFLNALKEWHSQYFVQICICGRFVTYIEVRRDLKEGLMRFFDLENDTDLALDAAQYIQDRWYGVEYFNWFMEEATRIKEVYESNRDACELLLSEDAGLLLN